MLVTKKNQVDLILMKRFGVVKERGKEREVGKINLLQPMMKKEMKRV